MKTIKNTNSFYVLGVKFENIQEAIFYAIKEMTKNGIYVGKDAKRYPCFDSEDYVSEDRFFWNIVTRYATLYKDKEGVWKVRLNNVDYIVQTGMNFYGRTQYICIGMGYYYYL